MLFLDTFLDIKQFQMSMFVLSPNSNEKRNQNPFSPVPNAWNQHTNSKPLGTSFPKIKPPTPPGLVLQPLTFTPVKTLNRPNDVPTRLLSNSPINNTSPSPQTVTPHRLPPVERESSAKKRTVDSLTPTKNSPNKQQKKKGKEEEETDPIRFIGRIYSTFLILILK